MSQHMTAETFLARVAKRLRIRQIARRAFWTVLILSAAYAVLLLVGRLSGLFPQWFEPWTVAAIPAIGLIVGMLIRSRSLREDAARAIDRHLGAKDLFLTWMMLKEPSRDRSANWGYQGLVERDAEAAVGKTRAADVVPFQWEHPSLIAAGTLGVLLLGAFFLPTLDPFGEVAKANEQQQAERFLDESRKQTEIRKAQLARKDTEEENSEEVQKAVEELKTGLKQTRKEQQKENLAKLNDLQKKIGEKYRNLNTSDLKKLFQNVNSEQKFGQIHNQDKFRQWQQELQSGKSDELQKEIDQLMEDLKELAKAEDPVERSEKERQIRKKLQELADFSKEKTGSPALSEALQRALQQMKAGQDTGLDEQAMQALQESLDLSKEELQSIAQAARDMKALEKSLEVLSMAKQCNANGQCDGGMFAGKELALADYAEMYRQMMGSGMGAGGEGDGDGTGGRGQGRGGQVDEDDSIATDFQDEKSQSPIQKGKFLMTLSAKGLSEAGEMKEQEYRRTVGELKQSLDEVITQEDIPPGYVDGIKKYFDTLESSTPE